MPDHDDQSQSNIEITGNTAGTAETSHSASDEAAIDTRVAACEKPVDEAIEKNLPRGSCQSHGLAFA